MTVAETVRPYLRRDGEGEALWFLGSLMTAKATGAADKAHKAYTRAAELDPTNLEAQRGRADLPWDESVRLDLHYVDHWSPAMDMAILLKTVGAVLRGEGAY